MAGLTAQPLGPTEGFNWVFLVELLICGILALFFLFYFNRLFATVLSYGVRAWTWHKYRAHVDISALQISLLGGRVFFKSIRYHAHNITVLVHDGQITWRYWLRQVQEAEVFEEDRVHRRKHSSGTASGVGGEDASDGSTRERSQMRNRSVGKTEQGRVHKKELPCRISVKVSGVEAFIYNRSPVYDNIIDATIKRAQECSGSSAKDSQDRSSDGTSHDQFGTKESLTKDDTRSTTALAEETDLPELPSWLRMLPINVTCRRAAAAVGNENTTSVLVAKVEQSSGQIDAGAAGPLDLYKLLFKFELKKVNVAMKPNRDFKRLQAETAHQCLRKEASQTEESNSPGSSLLSPFRKLWHGIALGLLFQKGKTASVRAASLKSDANPSASTLPDQVPGHAKWQGLTRYLDDDHPPDDHDEWRDVEYAKASTVADCEQVDMRFYWDIPGQVRQGSTESERLLQPDGVGKFEAGSPPEYGMDLAVHGGLLVYGPWADRQRVNLQHVLFPASYVDAVPRKASQEGDARVATLFKLYLSIEKDVTLRIPTRESSKDIRWQGRANASQSGGKFEKSGNDDPKRSKKQKASRRRKAKQGNAAADARPYGWLDITVKADSTVNYTMDMYARKDGYRNTLDLDVKGTEMTSSVNHALLWRAGPLTMSGDLSNPISWNALRDWPFNIRCDDLELFILRDHLFLIIDLVNDWGSGAPPEFWTFIPFQYRMNLSFRKFTLYLNTNDANIINDPADFDKNEFLTLEGDSLDSVLTIPMKNFRPKKNEIFFDVLTQNLSMRMLNSPRNTLKTFLREKRVAELPTLTLNGSYCSNQEQVKGLTDILRMDLVGTGFSIQAYGFLLRHLINVKENYFGDYIHFKTLEEFQNAGDDIFDSNQKTASFPKPKSITELDVLLSIIVKDATIMFPTNLYSAKQFVRAELSEALVDLRVSSYYLDLAIDISPVNIQLGSTLKDSDSDVTSASNTQLYISSTSVFGHRAFGLPVDEPAYASIWEIDVGRVTGECNQRMIHDAALAAQSLIFTFKDRENALPLDSPLLVFDASFVQVRTDTVRVWLHLGKEALLFSTDPISVHTNDWADEVFSQRVNVLVPGLTVACVEAKSATRQRRAQNHTQPARTYAFLQTSINLSVVIRKKEFTKEALKQQNHIRVHDMRCHRTPFLLRQGERWRSTGEIGDEPEDVDPPAMPFPPFPLPFDRCGKPASKPASVRSLSTVATSRSLRTSSSSSSLSASVRAAGLQVPQPTRRPSESPSQSSSTGRASRSRRSTTAPNSNRNKTMSPDAERAQSGLPPTSMTLSSIYAAPYFPLDFVEPDQSMVPSFIHVDNSNPSTDSETSSVTSNLEENVADEDASHVTVIIRLEPGIRAYVEPGIGHVVANAMEILHLKVAEDVMDGFQTSVLSRVGDQQAQRKASASVTQIKVDLPSANLRILNPNGDGRAPDVINARLHSLDLLIRIRTAAGENRDDDALSAHAVMDSLHASLHESLVDSEESIVAQVIIDDVLAWLALATHQTVRTTVGSTSLTLNAKKSQYAIDLAERIMILVSEFQSKFGLSNDNDRKRLLLLLYQLTQLGEHIGDPPFMTRMVYVLRAYPDHFRNQESWKVLMRFRNVFQSLPTTILKDLEGDFTNTEVSSPDNAPQKILDLWSQWRNWDVVDVSRTIAFQEILGQQGLGEFSQPKLKSLSLTYVQEVFKVSITDGSVESGIVVSDMTIGLDVTPPSQPTGLMLVEENKRTKTLLHLHSTSVALNFHWHLVNVLEELAPRVKQVQMRAASSQKPEVTPQTIEEGLNRHDIHVVVSTETGSITLHSVNLRHLSQAEGLRMSLIGTTQASETLGHCLTVVLNASRAGTRLHGHSTCIWESLLTSPSIYFDYVQSIERANSPPTITAAVAYNELQMGVKEQLPGILHIVDLVILDEASQVMRLVEALKNHSEETSSHELASAVDGSAASPKIHVALLAGDLEVELSLLHSLKYRLQGKAASVRVAPSLSASNSMVVDFATGRLHHSFINTSDAQEHQQGILDVPPINGQVALQFDKHLTNISVLTTIGRVRVEAEALQGVALILNQSEVQNVISAIKDGVKEIERHVDDLRPKQQSKGGLQLDLKSTALVYDVRLALNGMHVGASTPQSGGRSTADFELGIGPLHLVASNRGSAEAGDMALFPEVRGTIRDIGANLIVKKSDSKDHAGNVAVTITFHLSVEKGENGKLIRDFTVRSPKFEVNAYPETAAIIVDVVNHLQSRLKRLDLSREVEYIRRLRDRRRPVPSSPGVESEEVPSATQGFSAADLLAMKVTVELKHIQVSWLVHKQYAASQDAATEDLVMALSRVELTSRGGREGRLTMSDLQVQLVPREGRRQERTLNSAMLPEIVFSVGFWSEARNKHLAFRASGKPVDLRLDSRFIVPASALQRSIGDAMDRFKIGTANWKVTPTTSGAPRTSLFNKVHFASVVAEADFAGAQVYVQGARPTDPSLASVATASQEHGAQHGRYGQFAPEEGIVHTTLRTPGIALKLEYDNTEQQSRVIGELMIAPSSNMLLPNVVALALEISNSVKEVMQNQGKKDDAATTTTDKGGDNKTAQRFFEDESIVAADPSAIFGKTKVNLGLRVSRQEFGLTCQPIAKVDAKAVLEDLYFTVSTIHSDEHGHFFAVSATLTDLSAKVKHVYSREPTFSFEMESVVLSLMNSKHLSGVNGISAILKINPTKTSINGKQLQDLLLFREIWLPPEARSSSTATPAPQVFQSDDILMQRYQSVAAAAAFPWNATVSIAQLSIDLDLGQSIGKTSFKIQNLWASSQKSSNWEQNLCIGLDDMATMSQGRMSGFIQLSKLGIRTLIRWPEQAMTSRKTPLIQASIGFQRMRAKAAFDFQAFAFGDIEGFDFLMYNVREAHKSADRLVAVLDCDKAYVFFTSTSPAQAFSLYQAVDRLIQEKQAAFAQSLKDIEKQLRRESNVVANQLSPRPADSPARVERATTKAPVSLHTDVVVTLGNISVGAYPSTFFDNQILKLEANNIQARFAVGLEKGRIRSGLGMTIGQLQVALAQVKRVAMPKTLSDITVDEIVNSAVEAKGGIILRVPRVVASMETWQVPKSTEIEYIFKSLFEGKVDVGWNLNRINFIRGMWTTQSRSLAARLGKPLPESAVKITAGPQKKEEYDKDVKADEEKEQQKITAEVNLPQSKYEYKALEPPIIETPQLRDMGEATPPLEWIGLHRDRLPNVTHQIIIVSLLEVAKEVQDAYERILGSS